MAETRRGTGATAVLGGEEPAHAQAPEWLAVLRRFRRHRTAVWSAAVLAVLVACAALAEVIAPHGATEQHLDRILEPPGRDFLLGTDTLGRDNLSRVLYGGRVSLLVGGAVALISGVVGTFVGLVSGYYGRWVESALMRFADTMLALPGLMVVIIAARILGDGVWEVVVVLAGITWMVPARIVRGKVLALKEREFVEAQVLEVLSEFRQRMSGAMMIISHDLGVVAGAADRVMVMYAGHCVERGDVHDVYHRASHPYTAGLLAAVPRLDRVATRLTPIAGSPPVPVGAAPGCSFAPRCPIATEVCSQQEPDLRGPQGQPAVAALMEAAVACHHSAVDSRG